MFFIPELQPKVENPVKIKLSHQGSVILREDRNQEDLPLDKGAMLGGNHFGFILIVDDNGEQTETVYPTQCRISGVQTLNGVLNIFEDHKYIRWEFKLNGELIQVAKFLEINRPDTDFLANYGIFSEKEIEAINNIAVDSLPRKAKRAK